MKDAEDDEVAVFVGPLLDSIDEVRRRIESTRSDLISAARRSTTIALRGPEGTFPKCAPVRTQRRAFSPCDMVSIEDRTRSLDPYISRQ